MERPFPAYEGTEPFIFVCYAHDDAALVYPELIRLRDGGFHIWYDEGISPGSEWSESLAQHIQQCAVFLFFVTPRSVDREHCRREVNFALEERCTILPVHLEPTDVPAALKLSLSHRQAILRHEHAERAYEQKLDRTLEAAALGRSDLMGAPVALHIGDWCLDATNHRLSRDGEEHTLDPKELSVLLHLAEASPDLVTPEALLDRSWPGAVIGDNALHQVIAKLRRMLGDNAREPRFIETLPRRGYRLMTPVETARTTSNPQDDPSDHRDNADREMLASTSRKERSSARFSRIPTLSIAASAVFAIVLAVWFWVQLARAPKVSAIQKVVAVLDLRNLTDDSELDWIAGGLTEELRGQISSWNRFDVLPGALTRGRRAAELESQVDLLLDGFLRADGQRLALAINVVDTATAETLLSETFRSNPDDPLHLQRQLAANVARILNEGLNVGPYYEGPAPAAYAAYLHVLHAGEGGDVDELVYWLEQAVAADPNWADGWARLTVRYVQLYSYFGDEQFADAARAAYSEAIAHQGDEPRSTAAWAAWFMKTAFLDGDLRAVLPFAVEVAQVGGYTPIIYLMLNAGLFREAESALRYATSLTPNDGVLWELHAYAALYLGDHQTALAAADRVAYLNSDDSGVSESIRAQVFALAGRVDEARRQIERVDDRYEGAVEGSLRKRLGDYPINRLRLGYAAGDADMALSAADWMEQHNQPARAGVYRLLFGAERAEELISQGIEEGSGYLRSFWYTDRVYVGRELGEHPLIAALEEAMGYDAAWRLELCETIAALPAITQLECEPEQYRLPQG